jgi:hypothetical protein
MMKRISKILLGSLLAAATAGACTVPVFRFGLDRWQSDAYGLIADEEWKKSEAGKKVARTLEETAINLYLPKAEEEAKAGELSVVWPRSTTSAWRGKADQLDLKAMSSSSARDKIAKHILAGESAVWVMVGCGDKKKDAAFARRLGKRVKYIESVAAIPEQDPYDPDSRLGPGPELRLGFKMIRVERDDPKEKFFVTMLAGPEGEELLEGDEPFAGVVFGRGRVLGTWVASELDDEGVDEISLFLLGACSCRVKFMNPGWDLMMDLDWDEKLMEVQIARDEAEAETDEEGGDEAEKEGKAEAAGE